MRELQQALSEIDHDGEDRTELDDDREHFPERARQVGTHELLANHDVSRRTDRKELGEPFDDTGDQSDEVIRHDWGNGSRVLFWGNPSDSK